MLLHGSFVDGADLKLRPCNQISMTLIKGIKLFTSPKLDLIFLIWCAILATSHFFTALSLWNCNSYVIDQHKRKFSNDGKHYTKVVNISCFTPFFQPKKNWRTAKFIWTHKHKYTNADIYIYIYILNNETFMIVIFRFLQIFYGNITPTMEHYPRNG